MGRVTVGAIKAGGLLIDGSVGACGDDVNLVMTHERGVDAEEIHRIFFRCPKDLHDLLVYIGAPSRYVIKHAWSAWASNSPTGKLVGPRPTLN
jgi:fructose 1,6-bisphosphatase